ncbi:hypothetical protein BMS3Abin12_00762 [bacterium BMS3Abin12]|nr:hypothetical protein BMS3Abin12_00762 [bacterium BMS3Abin12]
MRVPGRYLTSALLGLFSAAVYAAPMLSLTPASQTVSNGSLVTVGLVVSGLSDFSAPSLSTFDVQIGYDPTILAATGGTIGDPVNGDQLDLSGFGTINAIDTSIPGTTEPYEISFDFPSELDTLQLGSFALASLTFNALAPGTSPLTIASMVLGDSNGDPLAAQIQNANVTVSSPSMSVPEPPTVLLIGLGLLVMACLVRPDFDSC